MRGEVNMTNIKVDLKKKVKKNICMAMAAIVLSTAMLGAGYYIGLNARGETTIVAAGNDIQLPFEVVKRTITKYDIESKLAEIRELSTFSSEYDVSRVEEEARCITKYFAIPGAKNIISMDCKGIVKVGYDFDDITVTVDNEKEEIIITLPEPKVNDNYVIWDSIDYAEKNSILNPIDFEQYKVMLGEIKEDGLKQAEEKGVYKSAEKNMKALINDSLDDITDYDVVYA